MGVLGSIHLIVRELEDIRLNPIQKPSGVRLRIFPVISACKYIQYTVQLYYSY